MLSVLEPGAVAACCAPRTGRIAVIATESTGRGGAQEAAIRHERSARIGATFLGGRPEASDIEIVDLATGTPILRS